MISTDVFGFCILITWLIIYRYSHIFMQCSMKWSTKCSTSPFWLQNRYGNFHARVALSQSQLLFLCKGQASVRAVGRVTTHLFRAPTPSEYKRTLPLWRPFILLVNESRIAWSHNEVIFSTQAFHAWRHIRSHYFYFLIFVVPDWWAGVKHTQDESDQNIQYVCANKINEDRHNFFSVHSERSLNRPKRSNIH